MSTDITNEPKNDLDITNESKGSEKTWATADGTWEEHKTDTFAKQYTYITKETKNDLSITNEPKN